MRLQRARRDIRSEAPDVAQQLLAAEDPVRIERELDEQRELLGRELDLLRVDEDPAGRPVDRERPDLDPFDARRAAAQQRVDPREQGRVSTCRPARLRASLIPLLTLPRQFQGCQPSGRSLKRTGPAFCLNQAI
jgi:hypothetical protein